MKAVEEYDFPRDLKGMSLHEKELLAVAIREFLIEHIAITGGHLASNLGIVELAIAIHSCFDVPKDKIIWDVGHQAYVHKILTGRARDFSGLRQLDGLSGFPSRKESPCDPFTTGHSSNSVSLMTGLCKARDLRGDHYEVAAVLGDGALTGGLAYEGMNNLGAMHSRSIIILNDNGMSIGRNTGAVSSHLAKLRTSAGYYHFKNRLKGAVGSVPVIGGNLLHGMEKIRDVAKYALLDGVLFEELGFTYLGPIDGHDIGELIRHLKMARSVDGPVVLHVRTTKGKGYKNAEENPDRFHGIGAFDPVTGHPKKPAETTYSQVFGQHLTEMAARDERILAITAAMRDGTGLTPFAKAFPKRFVDTGIAESHAATFAGGLAAGGGRPFVAIYSTFLQRAYDEIVTDVCLQDLPVCFCIDRAGVVGADGPTHHGILDISYLSSIPGLTLMAPADGRELTAMMDYALQSGHPTAIRYPKGAADNRVSTYEQRPALAEGAWILQEGEVMIWAAGSMTDTALAAAERLEDMGISCGVVDARFLAPFDAKTLLATAGTARLLVTLEDNVLRGGFGEACTACLAAHRMTVPVLSLGWPVRFIPQGSIDQLMEGYGLSPVKIAERIREELERTS